MAYLTANRVIDRFALRDEAQRERFALSVTGEPILLRCHIGKRGHCPTCDYAANIAASAWIFDTGPIQRTFTLKQTETGSLDILHAASLVLDQSAALADAVPQTKVQIPPRVLAVPAVSPSGSSHIHLLVTGPLDSLTLDTAITAYPEIVASHDKGGKTKQSPLDQVRLAAYTLAQFTRPTGLTRGASPILRWTPSERRHTRARRTLGFEDRLRQLQALRSERRATFNDDAPSGTPAPTASTTSPDLTLSRAATGIP